MVKGAGGEDSSWLGGCSLEGPDMLQQGVRYWGEGAHAEGRGLCWEGTLCNREGLREDRESERKQEKRQERRPLERSWGLGGRRLGGGPGHPAHAPGTCFPSEPPPGCLALGQRDPGEAVHTGQGAGLPDKWGPSDTAGEAQPRESRGRAKDRRQASDSGSGAQLPGNSVPKRSRKISLAAT